MYEHISTVIVMAVVLALMFVVSMTVDMDFQESCASVNNNRVMITGMFSSLYIPTMMFLSYLLGYFFKKFTNKLVVEG